MGRPKILDCKHCGEIKGETYVRSAYCKKCHKVLSVENRRRRYGSIRNYWLLRRYGISETQVTEMIILQGGLCAICVKSDATEVDHNHLTNEVRAILCAPCNTALGWIENEDWKFLAEKYLQKYALRI